MKIGVRGFALGDGWEGGAGNREMDLPDGIAVDDLLKRLNFEPDIEKILLVFVNGRPCLDLERALLDGDEVTIFPPLDGG